MQIYKLYASTINNKPSFFCKTFSKNEQKCIWNVCLAFQWQTTQANQCLLPWNKSYNGECKHWEGKFVKDVLSPLLNKMYSETSALEANSFILRLSFSERTPIQERKEEITDVVSLSMNYGKISMCT